MALTNTASNRFGPTSYVVGQTLGDGCNFVLVQDAINQAVADGHTTANPTTILVRAGIYIGTFTMAPGVYVVGVGNGSQNVPNVTIGGSIIIDASNPNGQTYGLENLFISDGGTTVTTINAGLIILDIGNCSIFGDTALTIANVSGTFSQVTLRECRLNGITNGLAVQEHNLIAMTNCFVSAGTTAVIMTDTARAVITDSRFSATTTYGFQLTGSNRLDIRTSSITAVQEAIIGANVGETVFSSHCTIDSSAVSGAFIDNISTFEMYDIALIGSALSNNAISTSFFDWKPHATTSATSVLPGPVRGTASFDSAAFTVTDGWVSPIGGPSAGTFPVDNGGPGVPLAGAMSFLGSTSVDFPNPSGIETHVGATTNQIYFEDRRWTSSLIVDPDATVGLRGTFTTITSALAAALPFQTIYVRPGTYVESFALVSLVNIVGLTTPSGGLTGIASSTVVIDGTISSPPGGGSATIQNLRMLPLVGPALLSNDPGAVISAMGCTIGGTATAVQVSDGNLIIQDCYITGGTFGIEYDTVAGTSVRVYNTRIDANSNVIELATGSSFFADNCILVSSGAGGVFDTAGGNIEVNRSQIIANGSSCLDMQVGGTAVLAYNSLTSPIQTINFNAVGPLVRSYHNTHICSGAASEYVVGPGSYEYCNDVVNPITFTGIDGATVQTIYGWRPWAPVATAPGTFSPKGACSFDDIQFTSTDGFIQATGANSPPFSDVSGAVSAIRNNGYYATAATTFTLDSLAIQGDQVIIYADTAAAVVVTANAGQQIRLSNTITVVAGSATNALTGDSLTLRFRAATSTWETVASMGNWVLV